MKKRWFLVGGIFLLVSLLLIGCEEVGWVSKEDYAAVLAERDSVQAQVASLQSELTSVKGELDQSKSNLKQVQTTLQGVRDAAETAHLVQWIDFMEKVNAVLATDWPTMQEVIDAWRGIKALAEKLEPALLPHIDNVITYTKAIQEKTDAPPPETASFEEVAMWESELIMAMGFYTESYRNFEIAVHSKVCEALKTVNEPLARD